jgi:hypothetical protein
MEDAGLATITVTRTVDTSGTSTVQFASADGTATAGQDYRAISGTLTFNPGESSKTFDVPVIDDRLADGGETVLLTLTSPTGATLGTSQAVLTINDQTPAPLPPPNPFVSELVPYSAPVGYSLSFPMRILGTGFDAAGAQVFWNNSASLPVVSRSTSEIDVTMTPSLWNNTVGAYPVMVRNPGNIDSNQVLFTVRPKGSGNPPPFVAKDPWADPNPTAFNYTTLNVQGGSENCLADGSCLRYTWSLVGTNPSTNVSFDSNNGTLAGSRTKVTFPAQVQTEVIYHFQATITDASTQFAVKTNILDVTVVRTPSSLVLSPKTQTITPDQTVTLAATIKDQFGGVMDLPLTWTNSAGSLAPSRISAVLSVDIAVRAVHITAALANTNLTDFADVNVIYGSGGVGSIADAIATPVPYKSNSGLPGVTFKRLAPGTKIRIFSTDGRLVQTLYSNDGSDTRWDLNTTRGVRASSGVYLYIIDGAGQKKEGKLVLIL